MTTRILIDAAVPPDDDDLEADAAPYRPCEDDEVDAILDRRMEERAARRDRGGAGGAD